MNKKIKSPSQLFEEKRLIALKTLEESERQKELEEQQKELNKRIKAPKEIFKTTVEEYIYEEEIPEEDEIIIDPIEELQEKILSIPIPKYYDNDIKVLKSRLTEVKKSIPEFKEFDPSDLYEKINFLKNSIEQVRTEIPEQIFYDQQLDDLAECILTVKESIPEIPEIKYYDSQLDDILSLIENVRNEIPVIPEIRYYDKQINDLEDKISSLPEVKYYDEEIQKLQENIDLVKSEIPEVKYYDEEISNIIQNINNIKSEIPIIPEFPKIPEVKYYDKEIEKLQKDVDNLRLEIPETPTIPQVKYYDEDIKNLSLEITELQNKIISNKIKEVKEIEEIKNLYNLFETKNRDISKKVSHIEEIFEKFNEETILNESIISEPPETKNSDPLTPLDQNFVTLNQLQEHYRLFISRVQQQLATLGGGGETRLEFLDDIDRSTAKTNNYYLKYDASLDKWVGDVGGGGAGSQTLDQTLILGNSSSLGMSVGVVTATQFVGDGSLLTNLPGSGNSGYANTAGIATYASIAGIATYATTAGVATLSQGLTGTPSIIVGIITATSFALDNASIISGVVTTSTMTETSILSLSSSIYRSATYQIQVTEGTNYNMTTINAIHDGSVTYMSEYGTINQPIGIATFSTDINSGFLRLIAYPTSTNSTTFKIAVTALKS